jgi:hypothetical protein
MKTWKQEFDKLAKYTFWDWAGKEDELKDSIQLLLDEQKQSIITLIENEPTNFPVRESDEFDAGGRAFKQALLSKLK